MAEPVLIASDVIISHEGRKSVDVVKQASIALHRGRIAMLRGPSGSGKSSLLAAMAGLSKPKCGTVFLNGRSMYNQSLNVLARMRLTSVGMVFQSFRILPFLNVLDNVALPLRLQAIPKQLVNERATGLLQQLGLGRHAKAMPAELSGGERQRVAVARAIIGEPAVVLADEPTANLDYENGKKVIELIVDAARTLNCAALIVTHDPRLYGYADTHFRMNDGQLRNYETP